MKRRRVLLVQPSIRPPGGGAGVAAWMIQALCDDHDVSAFTLEPFESGEVNRFFGTSIDPANVTSLVALPRLGPWLDRLPLPLSLLKSSLLLRTVRHVVSAYDLVICGSNEADLGRPGIQYVHFPSYVRPRPMVDMRSYHRRGPLMAYYAFCDRVAGFTTEGIRKNLTLVNSDWTGRATQALYGVPTITLYPPVAGDFPEMSWAEREDGFVCIGRLSPEKEHERIFSILGRVRERFPGIRLHLVGSRQPPFEYSDRILALAGRERAWVTVHQNLSRKELVALMSRQRYGIHGMAEEHFGMAVAEMVRAGCIPWVPDGGGQVEIVAHEALMFRSDDEAVASICATLADPARAEALRAHLLPRRERFSEARFIADFRRIVGDFFVARDAESNDGG